jgi:hypothetical protein
MPFAAFGWKHGGPNYATLGVGSHIGENGCFIFHDASIYNVMPSVPNPAWSFLKGRF